jgi:gluconate 5-dehydrogenase
VVVNGRTPARLEAAVAAMRSDGLLAETAAFDVANPDAVREGVADLVSRFGTVDILVNNAGVQHRAPIDEFTDADWRRVMGTNLDAPFYLARAVVPGMKARRAGKIINIASIMSRLSRPTTVPYQVSKGGIAMLTRGLAVELAPHGIQVNAIAPGFFRTEMNEALTSNPDFDAWVKKRTPAGRWADPRELAGAAVYLASPAAAFVTGQILYVDGGFTAAM